jgi:hypothetical protein
MTPWGQAAAAEEEEAPWRPRRPLALWKFGAIALSATAGNLLSSIPGAPAGGADASHRPANRRVRARACMRPASHLSGSLQTVLGTASVPATMSLSRCFVRVRYTWRHVCGAGLVVAGMAIVAVPSLEAPRAGHLLWMAVFLLSAFEPTPVLEEMWLKGHAVDILEFRAWKVCATGTLPVCAVRLGVCMRQHGVSVCVCVCVQVIVR